VSGSEVCICSLLVNIYHSCNSCDLQLRKLKDARIVSEAQQLHLDRFLSEIDHRALRIPTNKTVLFLLPSDRQFMQSIMSKRKVKLIVFSTASV